MRGSCLPLYVLAVGCDAWPLIFVDRYVVLGNHRDGWVFGAVDPLSGTAAMLEVSRALASIMKSEGWRPRRTIVFCSWGAEEYGLLGSVEFTEVRYSVALLQRFNSLFHLYVLDLWLQHFPKVLSQRAVSYLNIDLLMEGMDTLRFKSTPMLYDIAYKAARKV